MRHPKDSYILGIDQSTQGTKALIFDGSGKILARSDLSHVQIVNDKGWVEHNLMEIYYNAIQAVRDVVQKAGIDPSLVRAVGISNQRETAAAWDRATGEPVCNAVVWQCARGAEICRRLAENGASEMVKKRTGLKLSPYFSAAKWSWILEHVPGAKEKAWQGGLCCGTIDSWLVYRLTGGKEFRTDYSNASRTQLFNILTLEWDEELCRRFRIPPQCLPEVTDSNGFFGETDFDGFFENPVPIFGVLGDSQGALFGHGCHEKGMIKATYGTGSSVMMNIGDAPVMSPDVVTSLGWSVDSHVVYVLEGNINYTGAVITWLKDSLGLISSPWETEFLAGDANMEDRTYLVPAFTGLGAPYWDTEARASLLGMSRTTGKAEIVKAALDCIAYQITDLVVTMERASQIRQRELWVDGGPTKNEYLMQFQSDVLGIPVKVPESEELSGIGAAYMAGIRAGIYDKNEIFNGHRASCFQPKASRGDMEDRYRGWKEAVAITLAGGKTVRQH
ncbi:MAG: glycerol kinase GlpK [Hungatella sp.]|nr:glycerol kinase GlpK [Hungatella sp.]